MTTNTTDAVSQRRIFSGPNLLQIAMPMGGIGAGSICLNGHGGLQDFAIRNRPAVTALPDGHGTGDTGFGLLHIKGTDSRPSITKLLEGPLPVEKIYDQGLQAQGYRHGGHEGFPRFADSTFEARYPFGIVRLKDPGVPLDVTITGWNPFIPRDDVASGMPAVFLDYKIENQSQEAVSFEFSFHLSHLCVPGGKWKGSGSAVIGASGETSEGGGVAFGNAEPSHSENFGTAALYAVGAAPRVKATWFRGGWFDSLSVLWREVSSGQFRENNGVGAEELDGRTGGSVLLERTLAPGESVTYPLIIAWHFPNSDQHYGDISKTAAAASALPMADCGPGCDCGPEVAPTPAWRPFYAKQWEDARAVALSAAAEYETLRSRTLAFAEALHGATLPPEVIDAVASNLAILKSPTVLRQENGNVWAWEGCFTQSGCCHGSCTHVWNYAQALPHLFPALERTLREQELLRSMDEAGHIQFRAALPDGPTRHDHHAAADGQFGGILKLYRDWQISGDRAWVERLYPHAKRSLDYCIQTWDPDRKGGLFEPHHNTYDIEFWGPDGMCGSIYVGALSAMAAMAAELGHAADSAEYGALAEKAAAYMDAELFNGDYYQQKIQWEGLRDTSFADRVAGVTDVSSEVLQLQKSEGPKYQYGSGCLSDGIIGGWMAKIYGVDTPLAQENIQATLKAIFTHNYKADLFDHACLQRPGYALGHEPGLLLCSWPRGGKPTLPFVYSDEVWTGIEYQVASHLIEEGFVDEGLTIVKAARARYDGHVRNPFNEYECGSYYARAMASYALLASLSGFRYSAATRTLWFGPKWGEDEEFSTFFSAADGFGTIQLNRQTQTLTVEVIEGRLPIEKLVLTLGEGPAQEIAWNAVAVPGQPAVWTQQ
ncbi:MAG: GH116 family glycosyl hydrolase [Armatimonadota bacterium]